MSVHGRALEHEWYELLASPSALIRPSAQSTFQEDRHRRSFRHHHRRRECPTHCRLPFHPLPACSWPRPLCQSNRTRVRYTIHAPSLRHSLACPSRWHQHRSHQALTAVEVDPIDTAVQPAQRPAFSRDPQTPGRSVVTTCRRVHYSGPRTARTVVGLARWHLA